MYSYNEKDTVGKLVSNFWKISRVLRDTYDGRGSQRRVLTVLLKSDDIITQSALTADYSARYPKKSRANA